MTVGGPTVSAYLYHSGVTGAVKVSVDGEAVNCVTAASLSTLPNPTLVTLHDGMASGSHKVTLTSAASCTAQQLAVPKVARTSVSVLAAVGPFVGSRP